MQASGITRAKSKFLGIPSCDDKRCDKWSSFLPHDYIILRGWYRKDKDFGKFQWTRGTFQAPFVRETHFKSSKSFLFILVCGKIPSALAQSLGCIDASLYLLSTGSRTCPDCRWYYSRYWYNLWTLDSKPCTQGGRVGLIDGLQQ